MKRTVFILSLSAILLFLASLAMIAYTLGWIAPLDIITTNHVEVGDLDYTLTGGFIADQSIIVPGEELVTTAFSVDNDSSVPSLMRIQIAYTAYAYVGETLTASTEIYHGGATEPLAAVFASGFVCPGGEDYWYMTDTSYAFAADSGVQALVSSIYYDGNYAGIDYAGQAVTVTLTIQVSQSENVTWATLATYNFETGYPV